MPEERHVARHRLLGGEREQRPLGPGVAERAVALGYFPDGQVDAIGAGSEVAPVERGPIEDEAVVRELVMRLAEVAERARGRMQRLAELDAASEDVLVEVLRALEEQLWTVRAQLPVRGA